MRSTYGSLAFLIITVIITGLTPLAAQDVLRAGIATADITPEQPVKMSGYAGRSEGPKLSEGVHDRLYARVTAFERAGKRLVIVSTDLIGFYDAYEHFRDVLTAEFQLDESELWLTSTHTHAGPTPTVDDSVHPNNRQYTNTLLAKLRTTIQTALSNLSPVQLGAGRGSLSIASNRRAERPDGTVWLGRNTYGPTDKEVLVVRIDKPDGSPLAAMFTYPTHATSLGSKNFQISGDLLGLAAQYTEKIIAPAVASVFAGASGDINPWWKGISEFRTKRGFIPETELMGMVIGTEVIHTYEAIEDMHLQGDIRTTFTDITLPGKQRGEMLAKPTDPDGSMNITAAAIGDIAFIGVGCELLHEPGMAIKAASPFKYTFLITHCNGAAGYLAPAHLFKSGGYEIKSTPFAPAAADMVVKKALTMLYDLKN
jgi:neutral ceramidase